MDQPPSLLTMPSLFSIDKFATASSLPSPLNATVNSTALQDLPNTSFNSLGMVPQMGWNTWNNYGCNISESIILTAAHALVDTGLKDHGYTYVLIDDCWQAPSRAADGKPQADPTKFPRGLGPLVDEIHSLGLKAGIYSSAGVFTCGLHFGTLGYEAIDAQAYADWGFDYLKYDNCFTAGQLGTSLISYNRYKTMTDAIVKTNRTMLYSLCNWGQDKTWEWASTISNSYRITGDIGDTFDQQRSTCPFDANSEAPEGNGCSVANILWKASPVMVMQIRGSWADLDMLEVGNGGMTTDEYIVHFTMWSFLKSPLILGNNLATMDTVSKNILTNQAVININQFAQGGANPAFRVSGGFGEVQIWRGALVDGAYTVAIINFTDDDTTVDANLTEIFAYDTAAVQSTTYKVTDLWAGFDYNGTVSTSFGNNSISDKISGGFSVELRRHAGRFWVFEPVQ